MMQIDLTSLGTIRMMQVLLLLLKHPLDGNKHQSVMREMLDVMLKLLQIILAGKRYFRLIQKRMEL